MSMVAGRVAGIAVLAMLLSACAGTVVRPLFGMRDTGVSRDQATSLVRVALVPVQIRPAVLAGAAAARWEEVGLLNDDLLLEVLGQVAREIDAGHVHRVQVAERGIVLLAQQHEPQVLLYNWLKADDTSVETFPDVPAHSLLEVGWAPFAPPIKHVMVAIRLVDPESRRILGRAVRLILDSGFPPPVERARAAVQSGVRGVGLVTRE